MLSSQCRQSSSDTSECTIAAEQPKHENVLNAGWAPPCTEEGT